MILNTSTWKEFKLSDSDLFDLYSSKNSLDKIKIIDLENEPKIFNYISRSEVNNGVCFKICKQNIKINKGHCLTIGLDTQTSFYQEQDFYTGQNIQILRIKKDCSKYTYIFLSSIIKLIIKNKFQWGGNGATLSRLKKISIKLPVDANGDPDWEYMENYIKYLVKKDNLNILELSKTFSNEHYELNISTWKEFKIEKFFNFEKGQDLSPNEQNKINNDCIKCIIAKNNNCGVGGWKSKPNKVWYKNSLTIVAQGDGGAGLSYYVDAPFCANKCVWVLVPKEEVNFNKYIGMFLSTILSKYKMIFCHSNGLTKNKLKKLYLMLPVDANGDPDWEYMENYIKSLPYSKYL